MVRRSSRNSSTCILTFAAGEKNIAAFESSRSSNWAIYPIICSHLSTRNLYLVSSLSVLLLFVSVFFRTNANTDKFSIAYACITDFNLHYTYITHIRIARQDTMQKKLGSDPIDQVRNYTSSYPKAVLFVQRYFNPFNVCV